MRTDANRWIDSWPTVWKSIAIFFSFLCLIERNKNFQFHFSLSLRHIKNWNKLSNIQKSKWKILRKANIVGKKRFSLRNCIGKWYRLFGRDPTQFFVSAIVINDQIWHRSMMKYWNKIYKRQNKKKQSGKTTTHRHIKTNSLLLFIGWRWTILKRNIICGQFVFLDFHV